MPADQPKPAAPPWTYLEPPAGLSHEWNVVYRALAGPGLVAYGFLSGGIAVVTDPPPDPEPLRSFKVWDDRLRRTSADAQEFLGRLHGRAPRTWNAGQAILAAVTPVHREIQSAIVFLCHPRPDDPEGQANLWSWGLAELKKLDWTPLLAELAAAVVEDFDARPTMYLHGWAQILRALELSNNAEQKGLVRRLNRLFDGPIILPPKGGRPVVVKVKLVEWWNGLEQRFDEDHQSRANQQATVANRHAYARDGEVVPDLQGHVKRRRKKGHRPEPT
jgi:hypothetical protein